MLCVRFNRCLLLLFSLSLLLSAGNLSAGPTKDELGDLAEPLNTKITTEFLSTPISRVVELLQRETGVTFIIDPGRAGVISDDQVSLKVDGVPAYDVIELLTLSTDIDWLVQKGVVFVSTKNAIVDRRVVSVAQIRTADAGRADTGMAEAGAADPEAGGATPTNGRVVAFAAPDAGAGSGVGAAAASEAGAPAGPVTEPSARRLEYVRYEARRDAGGCTVEVVLRDGGEEITGRGEGPDTTAGRAEAASRAVMDGIGQARTEIRFVMEGAVLTTSRGRGFVIVSAHAVQDRVTVPLAGAAPVTRSPEEAAILASLQATNRWSG